MGRSFDELVAEAESAPINGWDFSWLEGRAFEERPSWGYSRLVAERYQETEAVLDLQSGGGEMLCALPVLPRLLVATEGWAPNLSVAARNLRPRGAWVVAVPSDGLALPFAEASFDLVTARHPVANWWAETARVLRPGGSYLSQQVGPHSVVELTEFLMGPQPASSRRDPELVAAEARSAGLSVTDLRSERLRTEFYDIGAVVYFLRLVVWIVPGFSAPAYRDRLLVLHRHIEREGLFQANASRFLIQAVKGSG